MNRKKKFVINSLSGGIKQLITLICGFVLTKAILFYYGSEINGLVAAINQYLGFIAFLELGIGVVVQSNLYEPLAKKDKKRVSMIVRASEKFFRNIAKIFFVYIGFLCIFFPLFIKSKYSHLFVISLFLIISVSTFAQYYFGLTYQLLLNADQKGYIQNTLQWVTLLINTILSVALMYFGFSIHVVRLSTSIIYVMRPLLLNIYVKKHYDLDLEEKYHKDPLKQKWNGFAQHIAGVVVDRTDVIVLSIFSSLKMVSVYTVYYYVVSGIAQLVTTSLTGLEAMWGNMLANKEFEELKKSFNSIEWLTHTVVTLIYSSTGILILSFVKIFTKEITDVNYYQPYFAIILVSAFAMRCLRLPYFSLINSALHFKQTQKGSFLAAIINIVVSVILVSKFGLVGVAIGTFCAMTYHTLYFVFYLKKNILTRSLKEFFKHLFVDLILIFAALFASKLFIYSVDNYLSWVILAIEVTLTLILLSILINFIFYRKELLNFLGKIKKIIFRIIKK